MCYVNRGSEGRPIPDVNGRTYATVAVAVRFDHGRTTTTTSSLPPHPPPHGESSRNEFVFGAGDGGSGGGTPPEPGRPARSIPPGRRFSAAVPSLPRDVDQCANGFCFTWASSSGAPAPTLPASSKVCANAISPGLHVRP